MEELVMLGTGHAMAVHCYNTCFLLRGKQSSFLVDAGGGNGVLSALEKTGCDYGSLHHMFVTHAHNDHVLGTVWMIRKVATMIREGRYEGSFTIFCHSELISVIKGLADLTLQKRFTKYIGSRIQFQEVKDGDCVETAGCRFTFFDIGSTKIKQFGFSAVLPDGQQLVCLGDEPFHETAESYLKGCDWLLCEAFCRYEDRERYKPYEKHHSTVKEACETAQRFLIPNLVLYHTEDDHLKQRKELYKTEGVQFYNGNLYVPEDMETIRIGELHE